MSKTTLRVRWLSHEPKLGCVQMSKREQVREGRRLSWGGQTQAVGQTEALRRIMVATDFSPASRETMECAVVLAKNSKAMLTVLHVIDVNAPATWGPAEEFMRSLWANQEVERARLARQLEGQVDFRFEVEEGLPAEVIVEKSKGYDLLLVGKKKQRRRWNPFARHTADRVARHAICPVIVGEGQALSCGLGK